MRAIPTILAAIVLTVSSVSSSGATIGTLFFSEYVEGSSYNKAIEIYNITSTAVDLSGYQVLIYYNGSSTASSTINLSGTLAAADVQVLANSNAVADLLSLADQTSNNLNFNGDDAVALVGPSSTVLDIIGQIGLDPGSEWGSGLTSTGDNTIRRKSSVVCGDQNGSDVFDPIAEWDGYATNTFSGLGSHTVPEPGILALWAPAAAMIISRRRAGNRG